MIKIINRILAIFTLTFWWLYAIPYVGLVILIDAIGNFWWDYRMELRTIYPEAMRVLRTGEIKDDADIST